MRSQTGLGSAGLLASHKDRTDATEDPLTCGYSDRVAISQNANGRISGSEDAPTTGRRVGRFVSLFAACVMAFAGLSAAPALAGPAPAVAQLAAVTTTTAAQHPKLAAVVAAARAAATMNASYSYGGGHGSSPSGPSGTDCSGFVRWAYWKGFHYDIGSGSGDSMIRTSGHFVRTNSPLPGDVVIFGNGGQAPAYHSGIYVGKNSAAFRN